ncbi:MAG: hypothetical protein KDD15_09465 [Lewinella sp.]|nr:hypothetical protein [Lewinella sp.]
MLERKKLALFNLLLIFLLLQNCREVSHLANDYPATQIEYSNPKVINLPLDSFSPPMVPYGQVLRGDTLKYMFYNHFNTSLYTYDFRNSVLIKKIVLDYEKGEKLPEINAFYYINSDSILLFPQYGDFFFICNDNGKIYGDRISFVDDDDQDKVESHWISSSFPVVKIGSKIYIKNAFGNIAYDTDPKRFLLIEYDLKTGASSFFIKHPPSVYDKNFDNTTFRHMVLAQKEPDKSLLYSFYFDPYIYVFDGDKSGVKSYRCAPENFEIPPALKADITSDDAWIRFQTTFSFSTLTYDPFKNTIIRVGLIPHTYDDIQAGSVDPEMPKKPKIYLFDKHYNLLGEISLNHESFYYFPSLFATEEGLWIQKVLDDENVMCFELIEYEI